ncbi:MAG: repeat-containing protein [Chitinophagaceae bacterium]|nr:repeat-containing protein [Chitinophagaceae bacterium]
MLTIFKISRFFFYILIITCFFLTATAQDSLVLSPAQKITNTIGIKYDIIAFDKGGNKPWHLLSFEYTRLIKKLPLIARLNYANRFGKSGLQLEAEAYPAISKKIYAYVNAGYSKDSLLFPKYRAGFSLYVSLPVGFEAEGGFRLLYFNSPTWIYTAAIGKYYKNYWFNFSTFLTPDNNNILQSYFFKTRYYLNDKDFIMLTLGTGISPDDRNNNIQIKTNKLSSKQAELSFRNTIKKVNVILINAGWMSQEYQVKKYTSQYTIGIGFQRIL